LGNNYRLRPMHTSYLTAIRAFEGFTPEAKWDYAQFSNGYGTKARYAGEVIDRAEADRRFEAAVAKARAVVERAAPDVDAGTKAALTSLTYNAGETWVRSGLGAAVRSGDLDQVRSIFMQYNKAGGQVLEGLVSRRAAEAMWIGNPALVGAVDAPVPAKGIVVQAESPPPELIPAPAAAAPEPLPPPVKDDHKLPDIIGPAQVEAVPEPALPAPTVVHAMPEVVVSTPPKPEVSPEAIMAKLMAGPSPEAEAARLATMVETSPEVLNARLATALLAPEVSQVADAAGPLSGGRAGLAGLSDIARLVTLDKGYELFALQGERRQDRDRGRNS
jgi:GH24 family phage-related lysozyme (muramidase)